MWKWKGMVWDVRLSYPWEECQQKARREKGSFFSVTFWKALWANKHIFLVVASPAEAAVLDLSQMAGKWDTWGYKNHTHVSTLLKSLFLTSVPLFCEEQTVVLRIQLQLCRLFRAWPGFVSLLPAKQSLLMSALINTVYSKCTLDVEISAGLSLVRCRVTSWHLSLEESG